MPWCERPPGRGYIQSLLNVTPPATGKRKSPGGNAPVSAVWPATGIEVRAAWRAFSSAASRALRSFSSFTSRVRRARALASCRR